MELVEFGPITGKVAAPPSLISPESRVLSNSRNLEFVVSWKRRVSPVKPLRFNRESTFKRFRDSSVDNGIDERKRILFGVFFLFLFFFIHSLSSKVFKSVGSLRKVEAKFETNSFVWIFFPF